MAIWYILWPFWYILWPFFSPFWNVEASNIWQPCFQVIWDYHVIFVYKPDERCLVFDLDSDLPFPTFFHKYVTETFRTDAILNPVSIS
jgi:hypothetical protein